MDRTRKLGYLLVNFGHTAPSDPADQPLCKPCCKLGRAASDVFEVGWVGTTPPGIARRRLGPKTNSPSRSTNTISAAKPIFNSLQHP